MTVKELAAALSGREYGMEISREEERAAKEASLVVMYGYSDDCVELRGAIDAEIGAYEGTAVYIGKDGMIGDPTCSDAEHCACPYFVTARNAAKTIKAIWNDAGGPFWTFETDIPHEAFTIMEDGEPFCVGIVFSLAATAKKETNDLEEARRALLAAFPGSFINEQDEFIAHPRTNQYFLLADCKTPEDIEAKVIEWLSRPAFKTAPYSQEWRNRKLHEFIRNGINAFLDTGFTEEDMETIYSRLGNAIRHNLTMEFIAHNMDVAWLMEAPQ